MVSPAVTVTAYTSSAVSRKSRDVLALIWPLMLAGSVIGVAGQSVALEEIPPRRVARAFFSAVSRSTVAGIVSAAALSVDSRMAMTRDTRFTAFFLLGTSVVG